MSGSYVETGCRMFPAGGAVAKYLRVKTSTALAAAGLTDQELGTIENASFASGDIVPVRLRTAQGTCLMVAAGAISADAAVYTAASGKISSTEGTGAYLIGHALEAASGNNSVIEVLRAGHVDLST